MSPPEPCVTFSFYSCDRRTVVSLRLVPIPSLEVLILFALCTALGYQLSLGYRSTVSILKIKHLYDFLLILALNASEWLSPSLTGDNSPWWFDSPVICVGIV